MARPMTEFNTGEFQKRLLTWFAANKRSLPWRTEGQRDPYSVVVSEVMLQQTQVTTVLRYYERWMGLFPNFEALAKAPIEQVLKAWEGMGYYSRARNLKKLAETVMGSHGGRLPDSVAKLENLPGIGRYSSRSIASVAFGKPAACVDGNIVRVLARLMGIDKIYKSNSAAQFDFQGIADRVLNQESPGEHNEAMMEFGATVCTRANPLCLDCPLRTMCRGRALGIAGELPRLERTKSESKLVKRVWIMNEGRLLLRQSGPQNIAATGTLDGLWELPTPESLQIKRLPQKELLRRARSITKYKITEVIYKITRINGMLPRLAKNPSLRWASNEELKTLPLSGPHAQWIEGLLARKFKTLSNGRTSA